MHAIIRYLVDNPEHRQEFLNVDLAMKECNGVGSGRVSFPYPAEGVDVRAYTRERMKAKLLANLGVDYDDACLIDQTPWPIVQAQAVEVPEEAPQPEEPSAAVETPVEPEPQGEPQ